MAWRICVLLVLCCAACTAAVPESTPGHAAYLGAFGLIVVAAWRGVRPDPPGSRLPFGLVAAAMTAWLAGDVLDAALRITGLATPPNLPDIFWLAGYPLIGTGLVVMVRRRAPGQGRAGALDGLTLTAATALCAWQLLVAPAITAQDLTPTVVIGALYPAGDIVLLASVLYLVLSPGQRGTASRLLVAGMVLTLACDLTLALPSDAIAANGPRFDGLLLLANGMVVASIRHPRRAELLTAVRSPVAKLHPARVLFLGLALLAAPLLATVRDSQGVVAQLPLLVGVVLTVGFSVTRFTGAVQEQARVHEQLAHLAAHDELTGLANRRTLVNTLEREFRSDTDTVVLYIDLDLFKSVNDNHGHAAGDAVLVEVGRRLQATVRPGDLVARLGGDEFAVLCHRIDAIGAGRLAERLAAAVARPIRYGEHSLVVGASVGHASARGRQSADDLIHVADEAMLTAKRHWHDARRAGGPPGYPAGETATSPASAVTTSATAAAIASRAPAR